MSVIFITFLSLLRQAEQARAVSLPL